ncbi:hypothetical protein ACA910_001575 [Epithemia clementina (nom. ined.)]
MRLENNLEYCRNKTPSPLREVQQRYQREPGLRGQSPSSSSSRRRRMTETKRSDSWQQSCTEWMGLICLFLLRGCGTRNSLTVVAINPQSLINTRTAAATATTTTTTTTTTTRLRQVPTAAIKTRVLEQRHQQQQQPDRQLQSSPSFRVAIPPFAIVLERSHDIRCLNDTVALTLRNRAQVLLRNNADTMCSWSTTTTTTTTKTAVLRDGTCSPTSPGAVDIGPGGYMEFTSNAATNQMSENDVIRCVQRVLSSDQYWEAVTRDYGWVTGISIQYETQSPSFSAFPSPGPSSSQPTPSYQPSSIPTTILRLSPPPSSPSRFPSITPTAFDSPSQTPGHFPTSSSPPSEPPSPFPTTVVPSQAPTQEHSQIPSQIHSHPSEPTSVEPTKLPSSSSSPFPTEQPSLVPSVVLAPASSSSSPHPGTTINPRSLPSMAPTFIDNLVIPSPEPSPNTNAPVAMTTDSITDTPTLDESLVISSRSNDGGSDSFFRSDDSTAASSAAIAAMIVVGIALFWALLLRQCMRSRQRRARQRRQQQHVPGGPLGTAPRSRGLLEDPNTDAVDTNASVPPVDLTAQPLLVSPTSTNNPNDGYVDPFQPQQDASTGAHLTNVTPIAWGPIPRSTASSSVATGSIAPAYPLSSNSANQTPNAPPLTAFSSTIPTSSTPANVNANSTLPTSPLSALLGDPISAAPFSGSMLASSIPVAASTTAASPAITSTPPGVPASTASVANPYSVYTDSTSDSNQRTSIVATPLASGWFREGEDDQQKSQK